MDDQVLEDRISLALMDKGRAKIRSGDRRSAKKARELLQAGADAVGIEVKISKKDDGYVAVAV